MTNPMSQFLRGSQPQKPQANNPLAMISEFRKFAATVTPESAKQQVEQMVSNGQISRDQLEQIKQQATEFIKFLK